MIIRFILSHVVTYYRKIKIIFSVIFFNNGDSKIIIDYITFDDIRNIEDVYVIINIFVIFTNY